LRLGFIIGYGRGRGGKSSSPGELYKHMSALLWLYSYGSWIYIQNYLTGHLVLAKLKTASIIKKILTGFKQRWKFSSDHLISSFFNKIFRNKMCETCSKQLEYDGFWKLYRGFPLFSAVSTFISTLSFMLTQMMSQQTQKVYCASLLTISFHSGF
jgi:hypothetical protein